MKDGNDNEVNHDNENKHGHADYEEADNKTDISYENGNEYSYTDYKYANNNNVNDDDNESSHAGYSNDHCAS